MTGGFFVAGFQSFFSIKFHSLTQRLEDAISYWNSMFLEDMLIVGGGNSTYFRKQPALFFGWHQGFETIQYRFFHPQIRVAQSDERRRTTDGQQNRSSIGSKGHAQE